MKFKPGCIWGLNCQILWVFVVNKFSKLFSSHTIPGVKSAHSCQSWDHDNGYITRWFSWKVDFGLWNLMTDQYIDVLHDTE